MGALTKHPSGTIFPLYAEVLVGRAAHCELRLDDPRVSSQHASLRWKNGHWEVRDLASRNGTSIDDKLLPQRAWTRLAPGSRISFGHRDNGWRLTHAGPPSAAAVPLDGGAARHADGGLLSLPDDDDPVVTVVDDGSDWRIETATETRFAHDRQTVMVRGRPWRLHLPRRSLVTTAAALDVEQASSEPPSAALLFQVSQDEENVRIVATLGGEQRSMGIRVHHYMLLTLARARLAERTQGASSAEEGWVYQDELVRMLAIDPNRLHLYIFRARKQFAAAGLGGAGALIERRPASRQVRIGIADLMVTRA